VNLCPKLSCSQEIWKNIRTSGQRSCI